MSRQDGELEELRMVSCAALLERLPPPWQLDKAESTKRCLKYRRGTGEIILVTHEGRGWWDPGTTTARGDVFNLVQHLQPGTTFGQVCKLLREFVGIAPSYPLHERIRKREAPAVPAITAFKAYVAESRATATTWTMVPEAATLEAVKRGRALGDPTPITLKALWDRVGEDMAAKPYKALGIAWN